MQPSAATSAPAVGAALTTEAVVLGCVTGANSIDDVMDTTVRSCVLITKAFGSGACAFFDVAESRDRSGAAPQHPERGAARGSRDR